MEIERNEYMDGKADAQARRPRQIHASATYEAGYLDGIAERSAYTRAAAFSDVTIEGMKMTASEQDGIVLWAVSDRSNFHAVSGQAPDLETAIAAMEGSLRQQGRSIARRYTISQQVRHLHPTASAREVERLTDRVVEYMLTKGA
jgi:hypothetical protein